MIKKLFVISGIFLISYNYASAVNFYDLSGWGQELANGCFTENGETSNGDPVYTLGGSSNGGGYIMYRNGSNQLEFNHTTNNQVSGVDTAGWYSGNNETDPDTATWTNNGGGTVGDVVATDTCTPAVTGLTLTGFWYDFASTSMTYITGQSSFFVMILMFSMAIFLLALIIWAFMKGAKIIFGNKGRR